jgi:hypothetical protein
MEPTEATIEVSVATPEDRAQIYAIRHQVYAYELHQHPDNPEGVLRDALDEINTYVVAKRGGSVVGLDKNRAEYERLIEVFRAHDIGYFFYNGGNDSADTCLKVSQFSARLGYPISAVHVPKTVDNDLPITDCCPGFGSVAKYVATSMREAAFDVASMAKTSTRVFVLEVMGRHAGWITAAVGLAELCSLAGLREALCSPAAGREYFLPLLALPPQLADGRYPVEADGVGQGQKFADVDAGFAALLPAQPGRLGADRARDFPPF